MNFNRKGNKLVTVLLMALAVLLVFSACQPNKPTENDLTTEEQNLVSQYVVALTGSDFLADINSVLGGAKVDGLDVTSVYAESKKSIELDVELKDYELIADNTVAGDITIIFSAEKEGSDSSFPATEYTIKGTGLKFKNDKTDFIVALKDVSGVFTGTFTIAEEKVTKIENGSFTSPKEGSVKVDGKKEITVIGLIGAGALEGDNLEVVQAIYKAVADDSKGIESASNKKLSSDVTVGGNKYEVTYTYSSTKDADTDLIATWKLHVEGTKKADTAKTATTLPNKITFDITSDEVEKKESVTVTIDELEYTVKAETLIGNNSQPGSGIAGYVDEENLAKILNTMTADDVNALNSNLLNGLFALNGTDGVKPGEKIMIYINSEKTECSDRTDMLQKIASVTHLGQIEAIVMPIEFHPEGESAFELSNGCYIIDGKATLTLAFDTIVVEVNGSKTVKGIYELSATDSDGLTIAEKADAKTGTKITFSNFKGSFELNGVDKLLEKLAQALNAQQKSANAEDSETAEVTAEYSLKLNLPYAKDNVSITWDGKKIFWEQLSAKLNNNFDKDDKSADVLDKEWFYTHFGTEGFLKDLKAALSVFNSTVKSQDADTSLVVSAVDYQEAVGTDAPEASDSANTLTITLKLSNYKYYLSKGRQQATSDEVVIAFNGTTEGSTFTAKSFVVSKGSITLSDGAAANPVPAKRDNASVTFNNTNGKIGSAGIGFDVSNPQKPTITDFEYDNAQHGFTFEDIEIK